MKRKSQAIIIASQGMNTSILCDGKLYWSKPITEISFQHKAGKPATIEITCDRLPIVPDEDERSKNNFKVLLNELLKGFLTEEEKTPSSPEGADSSQK